MKIPPSIKIKTQSLIDTIYNLNLNLFSRWFCHLDDDNYLNVKKLYSFLEKYDPSKFYYFGRKSTSFRMTSMYNQVLNF